MFVATTVEYVYFTIISKRKCSGAVLTTFLKSVRQMNYFVPQSSVIAQIYRVNRLKCRQIS
jgi:hypothetical protein